MSGNEKIKQFKTPSDNCIILPKKLVGYLASASAKELRAIIYICASGGAVDVEAACEALKCSESEFEAAVSYWRGAGIFEMNASSKPAESLSKLNTIQVYEPQVLAEAKSNDKSFSMLIDFVASRFEKGILNKNDLNSLFYLYNYLSLPADLICGIAEYCAGKGKKSMHYMMKTAVNLFEEHEIDTYDKLEGYIRQKKTSDEYQTKFKRLIGAEDRNLSSNEKSMVVLWAEERLYKFELVELAYDITIDYIKKYNINYMNSVLERWYTENITTAEQAKKQIAEYKKENKSFDNDTFDTDDFFMAAVNR